MPCAVGVPCAAEPEPACARLEPPSAVHACTQRALAHHCDLSLYPLQLEAGDDAGAAAAPAAPRPKRAPRARRSRGGSHSSSDLGSDSDDYVPSGAAGG